MPLNVSWKNFPQKKHPLHVRRWLPTALIGCSTMLVVPLAVQWCYGYSDVSMWEGNES